MIRGSIVGSVFDHIIAGNGAPNLALPWSDKGVKMSVEILLDGLNPRQREAATLPNQHALILAGAGTGKTKTIISRTAYLINSGIPASRIRVLTFTRRSASEIVERVKNTLGDKATGLGASTFHAWCMSLIHSAPEAFGAKGLSIIDRDDQIQLFRYLRGKKNRGTFPTAKELCDLYSFARNTEQSLKSTIELKADNYVEITETIGKIMIAYEKKKAQHKYLDYDDILEVVAVQLTNSDKVRKWVGSQYDCILIDETQDTNPLQWRLLLPLKELVPLFAVGDDAQSIYGFRGADFKNIHCWPDRVEGSAVLKLEDNYRSTQEILDVANWLLKQSPLNYNKNLKSVRGSGSIPQLINFKSEWEEGNWLVTDLHKRYSNGDSWRDHMILVRSSFAGRVIESALLQANIPYRFIGGMKLLESAHIKDVLSLLRLIANPHDEIAAMRLFTLWPSIGEVRASRLVNLIEDSAVIEDLPDLLVKDGGLDKNAADIIRVVSDLKGDVANAFQTAANKMSAILELKYRNKDWNKRKRDFRLVTKLAKKHSSILAFLEEYLLDPLHGSQVDINDIDDAVSIITIHSAKGTESKTCYVIDVSPGSYPSGFAVSEDDIEEERRVLYVALTRAQDNLIVTRKYSTWAEKNDMNESYFLNDMPDYLFVEETPEARHLTNANKPPSAETLPKIGIKL